MANTSADKKQGTSDIAGLVRKLLANTGPLLILVALWIILMILSEPFRNPATWGLLALEVAAIGIVAAGQTFVILTGGIDLSVEAMVSFAGVLAAILIAGTSVAGGQIAEGMPSLVAIAVALLAGAGIGMFQGMLITLFRMNPLIVTLGFRSMLLGVALVITSVIRIGTFPLPVPFLIALVVYFASWFVLKHTKFGRYTYAIGGNEMAARLSGIRVDLVKATIYGISGFLAAISGILVMGRLQSGAYQNGTNMTLASVAAVVIGGTSLSGGIGGIWGTLIGVAIIRIVDAGLVYLDVPSTAKEIVIGAIIVLAVLLDVVRRGEIPWLRLRRRSTTS